MKCCSDFATYLSFCTCRVRYKCSKDSLPVSIEQHIVPVLLVLVHRAVILFFSRYCRLLGYFSFTSLSPVRTFDLREKQFKMAWDDEDFDLDSKLQEGSSESWEAPEIPTFAVGPGRWDDEDAEEPIKENWDDPDPEPEANSEQPAPTKKKPKGKKAVMKSIRQKEQEQKQLDETLADPVAEKKRLEKLVIRSDYENLEDMLFGGSDAPKGVEKGGGLDSFTPTTEAEFNELAFRLGKKLAPLSASRYYLPFMKDLIRVMSEDLSGEDLKDVNKTVNALANEKIKKSKDKKHRGAGGKKKATLKVDNERDDFGDLDDYADFM